MTKISIGDNIKVELATESDLKEIAILHKKCFKGYLIASFGVRLISKFYKEFLTGSSFIIVSRDCNRIIGLCAGTENSATIKKSFINRNKFALVLRFFCRALVFDKQVYKAIFSVIFKKKGKTKSSSINFNEEGLRYSLLSICVEADYRGKNIAALLVEEFEKKLRERKASYYTLGVSNINERAKSFYCKSGMEIVTVDSNLTVFKKRLYSDK